MGEPRVLVPKTPFRFESMGAGSSVGFPVGGPVDVTGYAGGELAVMFYDRLGTTWNTDATLSVGIANALWSPDAPTLLATANNASPAMVTIRGDTPGGTLLRCGLSEYAALGAMVQAYVIAKAGDYPGDISATMSVLVDCSGRQPVAPYLMPGLAAWYRGDRCTEIQTEVLSIDDLSGNEHHLLPAASAGPTYVDGALNGCPGFLFGSDRVMVSQSPVTLSTYTVFAVFRASSPNSLVYDHGAGNGVNHSYLYTTDTPTLDTKRGGVTSAKAWNASWGIDNTNRVVREEYGGTHATHNLSVNGTRLGLVTAYGLNGDPGSTPTTQYLSIGGRTGNFLPMTGHLMELIVFSPKLSDYDAQRLERFYLGPRYGISVA